MMSLSIFRNLVASRFLKTIYVPVSSFNTQAKQYEPCSYYGANPIPTTPIETVTFTSSVWQDIDVKQNDIFIATAPKSGTTWLSEIVGQLLYNKAGLPMDTAMHGKTIWPEVRLTTADICNEQINQQRNVSEQRRVTFKTHFPVESLYFRDDCKYLFVARDYRDMVWSMHNHLVNMKDEIHDLIQANYAKLCDEEKAKYKLPFRAPIGYTVLDFWNDMMSTPDLYGNPDGGVVDLSFLWIVGSWLNVKTLPNIKIIHYNNLKSNLHNEMKSVAEFLDIEINDNEIDKLVEFCSLDKMRSGSKGTIQEYAFKEGGASFFHKGTNGRWQGILNDQQIQQYKTLAARYLDNETINWLETGNIELKY